ncbi:hypothetical protein T08_15160 [Trichinella sp. T8]|nr:hypothetical protein T08_15160 [Trichinella sp. T8]
MDAFPPPKIRTSVSWPDQRPETRIKGCDLRSRHAKKQQGKDEDEKRIQQKDMAGTLRKSNYGLPPLGLNYIRIRAHCSFIGRCLRYFIRPSSDKLRFG